MAGTKPTAILESVNWLTNSGVIVSREIKLNASVIKEMSSRLTEKFQRKFFSTKESIVRANSVTCTADLQRMRWRIGQVLRQLNRQIAAVLLPTQCLRVSQ